MPTYDYRCKACGHEFEEFQSITAPVMKKCPECKKLKLERLIGTGAAVMFKGGGFYETDYRSDSYKKAAKADSDSAKSSSGSSGESGSGSGSEKKSEPKPAKPEPKPADNSSKKPTKKDA